MKPHRVRAAGAAGDLVAGLLYRGAIVTVICSMAGCGLFLGYPNTDLGAYQDATNRRINATERATAPPSQQLATNYRERGADVDAPARARDWQDFKALFFGAPMKAGPFREQPSRCPRPDQVVSCSVTTGCSCKDLPRRPEMPPIVETVQAE